MKEEKASKILEFPLFKQMRTKSVKHRSVTDKVTLKV